MAIWYGRERPTPGRLNSHREKTLVGHLDIHFTEVGDDYLCATMPVDTRTRQPYGVLHGGASVAFAETMGSTGAACCIDNGRYQCFGQEINANHLRPVSSGLVTGTARPYHIGARSQVWGIEIRDDKDHLVCVSRITLAIVERRV
ncbi:MAG: 1,4-dihydroxy-2-naphthoyl-CoA hydrolase [Steroidobacteraceae bacterium]|nr:1,4-dihydroxy-2-naphthoyl-CoA hydrolase [Steroidobacteraceae bacterium]